MTLALEAQHFISLFENHTIQNISNNLNQIQLKINPKNTPDVWFLSPDYQKLLAQTISDSFKMF